MKHEYAEVTSTLQCFMTSGCFSVMVELRDNHFDTSTGNLVLIPNWYRQGNLPITAWATISSQVLHKK